MGCGPIEVTLDSSRAQGPAPRMPHLSLRRRRPLAADPAPRLVRLGLRARRPPGRRAARAAARPACARRPARTRGSAPAEGIGRPSSAARGAPRRGRAGRARPRTLGVRRVVADRAGEPGERERLLGVAAAERAAHGRHQVGDDALEQRVQRARGPGRRPALGGSSPSSSRSICAARDRAQRLGRPARPAAHSAASATAEMSGSPYGESLAHTICAGGPGEQRDQVGRVPPRGVDEQVRVLGHHLPQPREVGDRAWARIIRASGNSPRGARCPAPSAGIPRPAWISTGTRRSWATRDELAHARLRAA